MIELITDQRQLLKLAFGLSVDIEFLMERIKSDPNTLDENAREQLLEGIFAFLRDAIGLAEVKKHLLVAPPALRPVLRPVAPTSVRKRAPRNGAQRSQKTSKANTEFARMQPGATGRGVHKGRSFLFIGLSSATTSPQVLKHIYGGPLERIVRKSYKDNSGCNFYINFVEPEAAAKFRKFINTPMGRKGIPARSIEQPERLENERVEVLRAAMDPVNPARRVLNFCNYRYPVSTANEIELRIKLQKLDKEFFKCYSLDTYYVLPELVLVVAFDCIEAALEVMEFHKSRLLGAKFDGCSVVFGRDPADRPIPVANAIVNEPMEAFLTAPAPPQGTPVFYQSTGASTSPTPITTKIDETPMDICSAPPSPTNTGIHQSTVFLAPPSPVISTLPAALGGPASTGCLETPLPLIPDNPPDSLMTTVPSPNTPELSNIYQFGKVNPIFTTTRSFSTGTIAAEMANFADVFSSRHE